MTLLDLASWAAAAVPGPGAVIIFVAFLRDARRFLAAPHDSEPPGGSEHPPGH